MLLLDHNLSWRLAARLADEFPGARGLVEVGLEQASDLEVWSYARDRGLTVVAKDSDMNDLAVLGEPPPHLVWVRRGNCSTTEIELLLRAHASAIRGLPTTSTSVLVLT